MNSMHRIQFEKPDLNTLTQRYTVVDMHFHTHYSDGINSVETIVNRAKSLNIGVAITDHNDIRGAVEICGHKEILSIPGIEITSAEGSHILIYFYNVQSLITFYENDVQPFMGSTLMSSIGLDVKSIVEKAKAYKNLIIFPHPYCAAYTGINNLQFTNDELNGLYQMVHGVEVINSENLNKWNLKCALLGFNLDKSITGGSDGHTLFQLGKVVSYAKCKKTREAFLDAVKKKRNKVIGKEIHLIRKITSNGLKLKKNIPNTPDIVEKNIRYSYTVLNTKSKYIKDRVKQRFNDRIRQYAHKG